MAPIGLISPHCWLLSNMVEGSPSYLQTGLGAQMRGKERNGRRNRNARLSMRVDVCTHTQSC